MSSSQSATGQQTPGTGEGEDLSAAANMATAGVQICDVSLTYGEYNAETFATTVVDAARVHTLDLSGNNLSSEAFVHIVDDYIARMTSLRSLDLKDNKIGPQGAMHLFQTLRLYCPALTYLDVNENAIQDESMYELAVLLKCGRVMTLNVVTNHITPRGLPTLCDGVVASRTLQELSLAFNLLGDEGARIVADMLGSHPTLRSLDLSDNHIGDAGAVALIRAFVASRASKLTYLNLSVNRMGDAAFCAFAAALTHPGNRNLVYLDLGCNSVVGDAGRACFVEHAARFRTLAQVDLTSCDLSDDDAQKLCHAIESPHSSLVTVEHYNNPRITFMTEQVLRDASQAKQKLAASVPSAAKMQRVFTEALLCVSAALLVGGAWRWHKLRAVRV